MTDTAKRHKLLQDLKREVQVGFIEEEFEVRGHKYRMKTLNEEEETWSDQFALTTGTPYAMMVSMRAPKLAVSITAIDGVPVAEMFDYPDDWTTDQKRDLDSSPMRKRNWVRAQLIKFLTEDTNREFIVSLFKHYEELDARKQEVIKNIPN